MFVIYLTNRMQNKKECFYNENECRKLFFVVLITIYGASYIIF